MPPATAPFSGQTLRVTVAHASEAGLRPENQDFVGATTPEGELLAEKGVLLAVADGVGGHTGGREAAEFTVRSLLADYYATPATWGVTKSLDTVLAAANRWLQARSRQLGGSAGMATTLSALVLRGQHYHLAHVGDSRAYLWRSGELTRLSEDHVWPHPELDNVLRRAVGLDKHLEVDHGEGTLRPGDRFLLVSDGVWGALDEATLAGVLQKTAGDSGNSGEVGEGPTAHDEAAAQTLVLTALAQGSTDNCTALVATIQGLPADTLRDSLARVARLPLPPRLEVGQEIDGLTVLDVIHESRVTLLYRVSRPRETGGEDLLVLKTLRPEADEEAAAALSYEEWLARRVLSPCFPQVVHHAQRSRLYYLMTWHPGESLQARLARGHRFAPLEVTALGEKLLRALAQLHRLGILHRDIKPDNLHLDPQGQLRILDLGVAASDGEALGEINNPGTPSYMAPELFAGERATVSSDLYACGVTLYQLLTRHYPYGEVEPFQTPRFGVPVPPTRYQPGIPDWLENLLLKAVARAPRERFETAEEFLLALERGSLRPLSVPRRPPLLAGRGGRALRLGLLLSLTANGVLFLLLILLHFSGK